MRRAWLRPGTHVNSVGYNTAGAGEVDLDTVRDAVVVVEPAAIAELPNGLRHLYVALTRAVQHLGVVHARPLPPELGGLASYEARAYEADEPPWRDR